MREFFKGLKVVELASVLAGPAVGTFFAELGASVIKIENKLTNGDVTRAWRVNGENSEGLSAYYASVNWGKQSLMIDLNNHSDHSAVEALLEGADVVVSNYLPRVAQKFGLTFQSVKKRNSKVIWLDLVGYENDSRPAYDVVLQAETGWISMTGTDEHNPAKLPVALIDMLAGHQLKEAALMALLHREKTGEGSYTTCSLEASSLSALANQASNFLMVGKVAQPIGTAHPNIAPYGDWFESRDGVRFVLAIGSEKHFQNLAEAFDARQLSKDPKYASNVMRVQNRPELISELSSLFVGLSYEQIDSKLTERKIPFGKIKSLDEVLSSESAKEMVIEEEAEETNTKRLSGIAFKTSF